MSVFEQVVYGVAIYFGLCWLFGVEDLVTMALGAMGVKHNASSLVLSFVEGFNGGYEDVVVDDGDGVGVVGVAAMGGDKEVEAESDDRGVASDLYQGDGEGRRSDRAKGDERGGVRDNRGFARDEKEVGGYLSIKQLRALGRKHRIVGYGKMSYDELLREVVKRNLLKL